MPDVMTDLVPLVARVARCPAHEISEDSRFAGIAGWGSLSAMRLLASVESNYAIRLDLRAYLRIETVGALARTIADQTVTSPTGE